mmetsp:Transcript_44507/g.95579  ORF Transcript_44507/g.95579 Transcript_44507/m.95579 type:complete len:431 (-) Transcript_44507:635-1927(-)
MTAALAKLVKPLDFVKGAVEVARESVPAAYEKSGLSQAVAKNELRPGDHIYSWRLGHTYQHHGVVVHCSECEEECTHDSMHCCAIVHFRPPLDGDNGLIEITSLASFMEGRKVSRVKYGVQDIEFYVRRPGSVTTERQDPWPVATLRALAVLRPPAPDVAAEAAAALQGEGAIDPQQAAHWDSAEEVVYNLLSKNSELFARWCKLGAVSGIRHFRSGDQARSLQTSNGRFIRLGMGLAAATAMGAGVAAVATGATAAAAAGTAATAGAEATASAAVTEGIAATAVAAAARTAGKSAISALLADAVRHPKKAVEVAKRAVKVPGGFGKHKSKTLDEEAMLRRESSECIVSATQKLLTYLDVRVPEPVALALESPGYCCRLSALLVDVLEAEQHPPARSVEACTTVVQRYLDSLQAADPVPAAAAAAATAGA